jgi:hypothetical protein
VSTADVLIAKFGSSLQIAVIACVPTESELIARVA